ncbi:MAG: Tetratricopeptide repeat protein [Syntrophorhabdaceae bacterium PtaU1.Bin034]|jgi:tetratricopeptide (TPR) repeat protein|nr:MAG: Tetratricopeptide repeat protein [Syntrophorhabdaceae bacterium PtaU1.Bin034]
MEEKSLLDPCLKTVCLMLLALALASCALPRLVFLRDPLTPEEHINLGVSYEKRAELDAALKEYKAAAKKMPLANLYVGNIYFQQKEYSMAEKSYKKAIKKVESPDAYNNLAWLYYTTDANLDEAERLAMKAVELSPTSEAFRDTLQKIRKKQRE